MNKAIFPQIFGFRGAQKFSYHQILSLGICMYSDERVSKLYTIYQLYVLGLNCSATKPTSLKAIAMQTRIVALSAIFEHDISLFVN
jgi:hypothetical protein